MNKELREKINILYEKMSEEDKKLLSQYTEEVGLMYEDQLRSTMSAYTARLSESMKQHFKKRLPGEVEAATHIPENVINFIDVKLPKILHEVLRK